MGGEQRWGTAEAVEVSCCARPRGAIAFGIAGGEVRRETVEIRRILPAAIILVLIAISIAATGCNTVHGAGKDLERAGEVLEGR